MRVFVFILIFITSAPSFAANCATDLRLDGLISTFGAPYSRTALPAAGIKFFLWNIHKITNTNLPADFGRLGKNADLVLFQESVDDLSKVQAIEAANPELHWSMARSFQQKSGSYTGVATATRVSPLKQSVLISPVTELFFGTPKTALISEFAIENRKDTLMVVNLHAINFASNKKFEQHILQIYNVMKSHRGPLAVGGDYNTWNFGRTTFLFKKFLELGLDDVQFQKYGILYLDRLFTRGLKLNSVEENPEVMSSDHKPRIATFGWEDPQ